MGRHGDHAGPVIENRPISTEALIQQMDNAVAEVFERMLNRNCVSTQKFPAGDVHILARITFSGVVEAKCILEFPLPSAQILARAFLGPSEVD